jgi:hypothetical protein
MNLQGLLYHWCMIRQCSTLSLNVGTSSVNNVPCVGTAVFNLVPRVEAGSVHLCSRSRSWQRLILFFVKELTVFNSVPCGGTGNV